MWFGFHNNIYHNLRASFYLKLGSFLSLIPMTKTADALKANDMNSASLIAYRFVYSQPIKVYAIHCVTNGNILEK